MSLSYRVWDFLPEAGYNYATPPGNKGVTVNTSALFLFWLDTLTWVCAVNMFLLFSISNSPWPPPTCYVICMSKFLFRTSLLPNVGQPKVATRRSYDVERNFMCSGSTQISSHARQGYHPLSTAWMSCGKYVSGSNVERFAIQASCNLKLSGKKKTKGTHHVFTSYIFWSVKYGVSKSVKWNKIWHK